MCKSTKLIIAGIMLLASLSVTAQRKMSSSEYIAIYNNLAIEKMSLYGIPASITLAQGLLESGNGGSELSVRANNHFGIKCGRSWTGEKVYHDDDSKGECFRSYRTVDDSYRDHSIFLTQNPRYASLFRLDKLDYKSWAYGLSKAGYATNPNYPELLISLIERNGLYKYDIPQNLGGVIGRHIFIGEGDAPRAEARTGHVWGRKNGVKYIVTQGGETFRSLSKKTGFSIEKLLKMNDMKVTSQLKEGTHIYLKSKKGRSSFVSTYQVKDGDSSWSIAQKFGVRLTALLRLNKELRHGAPRIGQIILLK